MIQNKSRHALLGLLLCAAGVLGMIAPWIPEPARPYFLVLVTEGGTWDHPSRPCADSR